MMGRLKPLLKLMKSTNSEKLSMNNLKFCGIKFLYRTAPTFLKTLLSQMVSLLLLDLMVSNSHLWFARSFISFVNSTLRFCVLRLQDQLLHKVEISIID
jgi:hypothetical protein